MMRLLISFMLVLVLLISGCIDLTSDGNYGASKIYAEADPPTVFSGESTNIYAEFENKETRPLTDLKLDVYYTGVLTGSVCEETENSLDPGDVMYLSSCTLDAPKSNEMIKPEITTNVGIRLTFGTNLSAVQLIELISPYEYSLREKTGSLARKPSSYSYSDGNIKLQIDFSSELPIIIRDKTEFMYLTISNIGGGFVSDIAADDISMKSSGVSHTNIVNCSRQDLKIIGKEFPRIACYLNLPDNINYLSNYALIININYKYEYRKSLPIKIVR